MPPSGTRHSAHHCERITIVPLVRGRILPEVESTGRAKRTLDVLIYLDGWPRFHERWRELTWEANTIAPPPGFSSLSLEALGSARWSGCGFGSAGLKPCPFTALAKESECIGPSLGVSCAAGRLRALRMTILRRLNVTREGKRSNRAQLCHPDRSRSAPSGDLRSGGTCCWIRAALRQLEWKAK